MPRDKDKNNDSPRGRRDRPTGGGGPRKGRSGTPRGPDKTFAKRAAGGSSDGERRPSAGRPASGRSFGKSSGKSSGKPSYAGKRDARPARGNARPDRGGDRPDRGPRKDFRSRDGGGEKRPYAPREGSGKRAYASRDGAPRGDRPAYAKRDDRAPHGDRGGARPAGRFADRKSGDARFGDKRPSQSRGEGFRKAGPRKDFGDRPERGADKPWRTRDAGSGEARAPRDGARKFERPREERGDRPKFSRPREDRDGAPRGRRGEAWQDHPRSEERRDRFPDRPRRDNEDDSKIFARRPAFGGRGAYRERGADDKRKAPPPPAPKKSGERIAKLMARAGLASRRDAEEWVKQGRVTVNGRVINSPALDITANDVVKVDGAPLPERQRTRLFLYHKPRGLMTTHADPEGRPTVFDHLPDNLPRLISIGRLDFNTEGLLLLTNDGGLARVLELPDTGWLRRYRVRAHGEVTQGQLDRLREGVEVEGVKYGPVDATLERDQGSNVWITIAIREGKNREVRNILGALGLEVNRLIRVSYGPFQLGEIAEGEVEEVRARVLRQQLGDKIAAQAGVELGAAAEPAARTAAPPRKDRKPEPKMVSRPASKAEPKPAPKPRAKRSVVEDRKGRKVVVQRTGSDEARERNEAFARGRPQRPKRGYHGKRDLKPRD